MLIIFFQFGIKKQIFTIRIQDSASQPLIRPPNKMRPQTRALHPPIIDLTSIFNPKFPQKSPIMTKNLFPESPLPSSSFPRVLPVWNPMIKCILITASFSKTM